MMMQDLFLEQNFKMCALQKEIDDKQKKQQKSEFPIIVQLKKH